MEFIFDIETTGLPQFQNKKRKRGYPPPDDLEAYKTARIVSICWILVDKNEITDQCYFMIKPDDFEIPKEATNIHKISNEIAQNGVDIEVMFDALSKALEKVNTILSYNIDFDYNTLKSSLFRYNKMDIINTLDEKKQTCIMKIAQQYMDCPFYPKLSDAYRYIFHVPLKNAHHAVDDVMNCYKIYKHIKSI